MIRYLLDTNAVSDMINHRRGVHVRAAAVRKAGAILGTCLPVVAELYYGVEASATRARNLTKLHNGLIGLRLWPLDRSAAEEYGRLYAELIRRGRTMQQIDVMIAAIALTLGSCTVVTTDSDLSAIPGLAVENWVV